jgi:hypothetical protein
LILKNSSTKTTNFFSSDFEFVKTFSFSEKFQNKILFILLSILNDQNDSIKLFKIDFFKKIKVFCFLSFLQLKEIEDELNLNYFKDNYSLFSFLDECIQSANKCPFVFVNNLEDKLNITISPIQKYKASISKDNFIYDLFKEHIIVKDKTPNVFGYIDSNELGFYLLTNIMRLNHSIDKVYTEKINTINSQRERRNESLSKIDFYTINMENKVSFNKNNNESDTKHTKNLSNINNLSLSMVGINNNKQMVMNCNNITKIDSINDQYISMNMERNNLFETEIETDFKNNSHYCNTSSLIQ